MLRNNNDKIIARLALRSLKNGRRKSVIMLMAVMLASFMIFSVLTVGLTYFNMMKVQNLRINGCEMDAIMYGVTDEQREKCENDPDIKNTGIVAIAGYAVSTEKDDTLNSALIWFDDSYWNEMARPAREWVKGRYPEKVNEVMVTDEVLEKCGLEGLDVGDTFSMVYGDGNGEREGEFTICGMWDGYGSKNDFCVSKAFYDQSGRDVSNVNCGRYYIDFDKKFMTEKEQNAFIESMELEKQQSLFFMSDYAEGIKIAAGIAVIILVTCLCAYLLIYNIMYISVSGNIRYYGLLQTVGMTERQVYRFVQRQTGIIGAVGIAAGLLAGIAVSLMAVPSISKSLAGYTKIKGDIDVSLNPLIVLIAIVIVGITVYVSGRKPAKMAMSISPVDAVRYRQGGGSKGSRKTGKRSIAFRMAKQQVFGDKKRSIIVILSLAASLSVFLCIASLLESQGPRTMIYNFMDLDMVVKDDTMSKENHHQWERLIDHKLMEDISVIEGVEKVYPMLCGEITVPWEPEFSDIWMHEAYDMWMEVPYEDVVDEYNQQPENFGSFIVGIDGESFDYLNEALEEAGGRKISRKDFMQGKSCILYRDRLEFTNKDFKGKQVVCAQYDDQENTRAFDIAALTDDSYCLGPMMGLPPTVIVSEKAVKEFINEPFVHKIGVKYTEEYDEETEKELLELINSHPSFRDFTCDSKLDGLKYMEKAQGNMPQVGLAIILILAFIGVMNYINTIACNIQSRRMELAVLESIGMTGKQRNRMFIFEGLIYTAGTLIVTSTVGLGVTYYIYQAVNYRGVEFMMPAIPVIVAVVLIAAVCCLVPLAVYSAIERKGSIVERIRV